MTLKMMSITPKWLPVCPPVITLNCWVHFHESWYGHNDIQGDLSAMIFNPMASIILKLLMFNVVR
jgi:hypothetical protein